MRLEAGSDGASYARRSTILSSASPRASFQGSLTTTPKHSAGEDMEGDVGLGNRLRPEEAPAHAAHFREDGPHPFRQVIDP